MDDPAEDTPAVGVALGRPDDQRYRAALTQALVRSAPVVVVHVGRQHPLEVPLMHLERADASAWSVCLSPEAR
jgi:hypothetical protein